MAMGAGRGRVAPGDAPGESHAHEPSPPRFTPVRGETLVALVPDDEDSAWSLVVTREDLGRLRPEPRERARARIADAPRVSSRVVYGCVGAVRTPSGRAVFLPSPAEPAGGDARGRRAGAGGSGAEEEGEKTREKKTRIAPVPARADAGGNIER